MTLDEIEQTLPWGLHDAYLERLEIDWTVARLELDVRVMMTEHQDEDQRSRITITGVVYCVIDAPEIDPKRGYEPMRSGGLWIGAGAGFVTPDAKAHLPATLDGCFVYWIFVRDWNGAIHICARDATLTWIEPEPVAARSGGRALFPGEMLPD